MAELQCLQNFPTSTLYRQNHSICTVCASVAQLSARPAIPPQLDTLASVLSYSYSDPNPHDRLAHTCKTKLYWALTLRKHLFWTLKHHFVEVIPQGQQSYDMTILRTSHIRAYENVDPPFTKSTTASKSKDKCTKF